VAVLTLARVSDALAVDFHKDETPLPKSVTDGSGGSSAIGAGGGVGTIARMIVGLAIVLAVVYGIYWLLKSTTRSRSSDTTGRIEVVATTQLAHNRTLHLLRCGDELILVGAAEHGVTPLRVYNADESAAFGLLEDGTGAASPIVIPEQRAVAAPRPRGALALMKAWTVRT
jgi:flagellar protein FliO/FliZ